MLIENLSPEEARILGALLEKSLATPDYYPMTLNALRTACNQKSSREPVTDYDDAVVSQALAGLKRKTLVTFIPYGSQPGQFKYRHFLEDVRFNLRKQDLAVLAVLLLRGAQTLNEIRTRTSNLHELGGLEKTEAVLKDMAARAEPLVEPLAKRPGWKEPRWRDTVREHADEAGDMAGHGAASGPDIAEEAEAMEAVAMSGASAASAASASPHAAPSSTSLRDEVEALKKELAALRDSHEALKKSVEGMRADLY